MIIKRVRTGCIHRFWMDHNRRLVRFEREVDWHVVTFLWCVPPVATKHGRARCCGDRKLHCRWWCDPRICVGLQSALREASLGHSTWSIYLNLLGRQRPSYGSFYWGHYRREKKFSLALVLTQNGAKLVLSWSAVGPILRFLPISIVQRKWYRNILMKGFHLCVRLVAGGGIRDTQVPSLLVNSRFLDLFCIAWSLSRISHVIFWGLVYSDLVIVILVSQLRWLPI
jgi:hypothetical protein